jgi:hypothetical protein
MTTQVKIRLGGINLDAYQLGDRSYAAPGLFRLNHTDIYRYGECWYFLGNEPSDMAQMRITDHKGGGLLAFQGNKLCYIYVNPVNPEIELYVPIPCDLPSVIGFCALSRLVSDKAIAKLKSSLDLIWHPKDPVFLPTYGKSLLKDTSTCLPKVRSMEPGLKAGLKASNSKKSSATPSTYDYSAPTRGEGVIYLVKLDKHLKLGFTKNLDARLGLFRNSNARVKLIKTVKGTRWMEKDLHLALGSKVRELYSFRDEKLIAEAMDYKTISELSNTIKRHRN